MKKQERLIKIAVYIITDSTCDLSPADCARMNIEVLPLSVHFDDISYLDDGKITSEQFYEKLEISKDLPTTSQIPPEVFVDAFSRHLDNGDEVVGIFLSGSISGTYQSACIAKNTLNSDKLFIIDSLSATMSLALLVCEAAKYRDENYSAAEIAEFVTELRSRVRFFAAVNTLKYLKKGGRIPATTAVVGEILGIKPIVTIVDGVIYSIDKARGMPAAVKSLLRHVQLEMPDLRYSIVFAHSDAPELLKKTIDSFKKPLELKEWLICNIGSVIGAYAGKGAVGFSYIAK